MQPTSPQGGAPKDPQPSVDRIEELARKILRGEILLPKFQRSFVWGKEQIITLLDSIAKGFPIGSVLLWESRNALSSEDRLADLDIAQSPPTYPVKYLLDGQQRLSAICGALFWRGSDVKSRWNIVYDLRKKKFLHIETSDDPPLHQIRINLLSEPSTFFRHVASLDTLNALDRVELKRAADQLFNRFKDYKIATVTLADMSIDDVAPIFERINSTSTTLTIVDLMRAATWSMEFDLVDRIEGILKRIAARGFEDIEHKVILRNISAAAGGSFSVESIDGLREYNAAHLDRAVAETSDAYDRTVDFLSSELNIPSAKVVPYSNQLVVLAELFRILPTPSTDKRKTMASWFWRTSISGHFSGWNTGMMRSDLDSIRKFVAGERRELTTDAEIPSDAVWRETVFRTNNAKSKLLALLLAKQNPLDLWTGELIDPALALSAVGRSFGYIFSVSSDEKNPEIKYNTLANTVILSEYSHKVMRSEPANTLGLLSYSSGEEDLKERLASNLISKEAYRAAIAGDASTFLALRAGCLQAAFEKLVLG